MINDKIENLREKLNELIASGAEYEEIYKIEVNNIHKNKFDYDIVYRDSTIMYMDSSKNKDGVKFMYYDIYTYELIDEVLVGGK